MTKTEARNKLAIHSGAVTSAQLGFLDMLRPYRGLRSDVFADLAQAVTTILPDLRQGPHLDREMVNALWGIVFFSQYWAINPSGMLQSNGLITSADVERLRTWVDALAWAVAMALDGQDDASCLSLLRALPESGVR